MKEDEERARWQALLAKLEHFGTTVAAVEAAYRRNGGPFRAVARLHGVVERVHAELCPFVAHQLGAATDPEEQPRAVGR